MFQINDYIVFGMNGVCQILDKRVENLDGVCEREYFVLNPLNSNNATIYAPADKSLPKMRNLMKKNEILELIEKVINIEFEWIEDNQARRNYYNQVLETLDQQDLLIMIRTLNEKQDELALEGRKLSSQDNEFRKRAEALVNDEIALVLEIDPDDVLSYIIADKDDQNS